MTSAARRSERRELDTTIEFIGDFDVVEARGVNVSGGGICFDVTEALAFEMRYEFEGVTVTRRARLSWLERLDGSGYRVGLEFVTPEGAQ